MTHQKALKALLQIAELTHPEGNYSRMRAQQDAMVEWFNKWLVQVNAHETVLRKEYLVSEYKDFIKEKLVYNMLDSVTEDCAEFTEQDKTIKVRLYALRRGDKP